MRSDIHVGAEWVDLPTRHPQLWGAIPQLMVRGAGGLAPPPRAGTWPKQAHQSPGTSAKVTRKDSLESRAVKTRLSWEPKDNTRHPDGKGEPKGTVETLGPVCVCWLHKLTNNNFLVLQALI